MGISGTLSCSGGLIGKLSVPTKSEHDTYNGDYEVVPDVFGSQILKTANRVLSKDIVVKKIPYQETSNTSEGVTVYIGKEV